MRLQDLKQFAASLALVLIELVASVRADEMPHCTTDEPHCRCVQAKRPNCQARNPSNHNVVVNYPICFYDVELGAVETARAAWPSYSDRLRKVLDNISSQKNSATVLSSRNVVVITSQRRHAVIKSIWPELACYGQTGGSVSAQRRKICVNHVKAMLGIRLPKMNDNEDAPAEPICQTFL